MEEKEDPLSVANKKYKEIGKQDLKRRGFNWHWGYTALVILILWVIIFYLKEYLNEIIST